MNITMWAGILLVVLGAAGVLATAAPTSAIPILFGLVLMALGTQMRHPTRAPIARWIAAGVGALGLLATGANVLMRLVSGTFQLNAAVFANVTMALICALFLGLLLWEQQQARRRSP
jgi:apolipoprotein N-acyltransferase